MLRQLCIPGLKDDFVDSSVYDGFDAETLHLQREKADPVMVA